MKKFFKLLAKVLIVFILVFAILFCGYCVFHHIGMTHLANIAGDYEYADGSGLCLSIEGIPVPYFETVDIEAANPGVAGRIIYLDENTIIIKINKSFFFDLPGLEWKTSSSNSKLEMHYVKSGYKLILENNGEELEFYDESAGIEFDEDMDDDLDDDIDDTTDDGLDDDIDDNIDEDMDDDIMPDEKAWKLAT